MHDTQARRSGKGGGMTPVSIRICATLLSLLSTDYAREAKLREFQMTEGQHIPHWPELLIAELDSDAAIRAVQRFAGKRRSA